MGQVPHKMNTKEELSPVKESKKIVFPIVKKTDKTKEVKKVQEIKLKKDTYTRQSEIVEPIKTKTIGKFLENLECINDQDAINKKIPFVSRKPPKDDEKRITRYLRSMIKERTLRVNNNKIKLSELRNWATYDKKNPPRQHDEKLFWRKGTSKKFAEGISDRLMCHEPIISRT